MSAPADKSATAEESKKVWVAVIEETAEKLSNFIVRAAELILLTSAFGYAAYRTGNLAVGLLFLALATISACYIEISILGVVLPPLGRFARSKQGVRRWVLTGLALVLGLLIGAASFLAVWGIFDAIRAAAD